jgi:hypothetical protein
MFDILKSWLSSLTPIQFQEYTAFTTTLLILITGSRFIYDLNKDRIKITVTVERDRDSLPAIQQPLRNYLLLKVINKSSNPVVINEIGVITQSETINLVDTPWIFTRLKEDKGEILGSLEWVAIPGTVNPQSMGIALILFSNLEEAYKNIKKEKELSSEDPGYLRTVNLVTTYEELMKPNSYNTSTQVLTVKPYTVITTGQRFIGKKTKIQLGNLHTSVQAMTQKKRFL